MKKLMYIGVILLAANLLFSVIYNTYFGWNELPVNDSEELCDSIFVLIDKIAIIIYLAPLVWIYVDAVKEYDKKNKG